MAQPFGIFDPSLRVEGWFGTEDVIQGWFDKDLIPSAASGTVIIVSSFSFTGAGSTNFADVAVAVSAFSLAGTASGNLVSGAIDSSPFAFAGAGVTVFADVAIDSVQFSMTGTASQNLVSGAIDSSPFAMAGSSSVNLVGVAVDVVLFALAGSSSTNLVDAAIATSGYAITGSSAVVILDVSVDVSEFSITGAETDNLIAQATASSNFSMQGVETDNLIILDASTPAAPAIEYGLGSSGLKSGLNTPQTHLWRGREKKPAIPTYIVASGMVSRGTSAANFYSVAITEARISAASAADVQFKSSNVIPLPLRRLPVEVMLLMAA